MKYCFVLILAFQLGFSFESLRKTDKKWKNITKFSCKRINCPPVEEPTCVRMRNKKIGSKTKDIYIMLLNRCEMEYMKCHQDYQATQVSMKNCGHYDKSLGQSGGKIRAKRSLNGINERGNLTDKPVKKRLNNQGNEIRKQFKFRPYRPRSIMGDLSIFGPPYGMDMAQLYKDRKSKPSEDASDQVKEEVGKIEEEDSEKSNEASERESEENIVDETEDADIITIEEDNKEETTPGPFHNPSDDNNENESAEETEQTNNNDSSDSNKGSSDDNVTPENEIGQFESNGEDQSTELSKEDSKILENTEQESQNSKDIPKETSETEEFSTTYVNRQSTRNPKESVQYRKDTEYDMMVANEGVDFDEYGKQCPTVCPAAEVMLCGRCKDGIYRTFMSVCHLRMFNCKHPDEKVELVTRFPCVLSAPYLNESSAPRGRVSQPGEKDVVLQFIRNREKNGENNDNGRGVLGTVG